MNGDKTEGSRSWKLVIHPHGTYLELIKQVRQWIAWWLSKVQAGAGDFGSECRAYGAHGETLDEQTTCY